jgi:hypothetical protein
MNQKKIQQHKIFKIINLNKNFIKKKVEFLSHLFILDKDLIKKKKYFIIK